MLSTESALRKDKRDATARLSSLQHRHYAVIAGLINRLDMGVRAQVAAEFANAFEAANDNFNRSRFITACTL